MGEVVQFPDGAITNIFIGQEQPPNGTNCRGICTKAAQPNGILPSAQQSVTRHENISKSACIYAQ